MTAVQLLTGQRRLAADRVPDARRQAVLRRHLLPARATATACPAFRACCSTASRRRTGEAAATTCRAPADQLTRATRGSSRPLPAGASRSDAGAASRAAVAVCARASTATTAASASAPKFPQHDASSSCFLRACAAHRRDRRCCDMVRTRSTAWRAAASTTSSAAASTATRVDAALARPALREDAVRQRAARPAVPRRRTRRTGDAVLRAHRRARRSTTSLREMRDPDGRLLLDAGRRQRGRGGQVLRLGRDEVRQLLGEDEARARRPLLGRHRRRQLRAPQHPARHARRSSSSPSCSGATVDEVRARARRRARASCSRRASSASSRGATRRS